MYKRIILTFLILAILLTLTCCRKTEISDIGVGDASDTQVEIPQDPSKEQSNVNSPEIIEDDLTNDNFEDLPPQNSNEKPSNNSSGLFDNPPQNSDKNPNNDSSGSFDNPSQAEEEPEEENTVDYGKPIVFPNVPI